MATTTIPWGDGSGGNIYLTYPSASGYHTVTVGQESANTSSVSNNDFRYPKYPATGYRVKKVFITGNQSNLVTIGVYTPGVGISNQQQVSMVNGTVSHDVDIEVPIGSYLCIGNAIGLMFSTVGAVYGSYNINQSADSSADLSFWFEGVSDSVSIEVTSDSNTGAARSKVVTFTSGTGNIQRQLTINQDAGLPYTPLSYIETDGVAYIDTGIKGNAPKSFRFKLMPVAPSSGNSYYFGCRKDTGNTRFLPLIVTIGKKAGFGYGSGVYTSTIDISASINNQTAMDVQCVLKANPQSFGVKQAGASSYTTMSGTASGTQTTNRNMLMFGYDYAGTGIGHCPAGVKWYECKIYSSSDYTNLVFDGVPCYYNGEYGLWDLVSNSFFGNVAGNGAFTGA